MSLQIYLHPGLPAGLKSQIRAQFPKNVTVTSDIFSGDYGIRRRDQIFYGGQFAQKQHLVLVHPSPSFENGLPSGCPEFMMDTLCLVGGDTSLNVWLKKVSCPEACASLGDE